MPDPDPAPRPIVLTFLGHYLPGWRAGGPVRSLANLVERLGDRIEFRIVTFDRDLDGAPYPGIRPDEWVRVGKGFVRYIRGTPLLPLKVARIVRATPHDVLYLNGFFDRTFTLPAFLGRVRGPAAPTCIIAPRGEFSPGALGLKRVRKQVHLRMSLHARGLGRVRWHAASEHEATDIRSVLGARANIIVAENPTVAVQAPGLDPRKFARAPGDPLRIVFLARITPKKNLDWALQVLAQTRVPVEMRIVGEVDDEAYWDRCRQQMLALPSRVRVVHEGGLPHEDVLQALPDFDLSFLPTRGENFGHSIIEALAAGVPVLISDQTPWRGLAQAGAGWDLPLSSPAAFAAAIDECARFTPEEREARSRSALAYALRAVQHEAAIARSLELFMGASRASG